MSNQQLRPDKILEVAHRAVGKVQRFHTEFTIQTQTISDHVYNILRIYYAVFGPPPEDMLVRIIFHDFEEYFIGDIPHWASSIPEIQEFKYEQERLLWKRYNIPITFFGPNKEFRLRICDWIEALEFMLDEELLGNATLRHGLERLYEKVQMECALADRDGAAAMGYLEKTGFHNKYDLIIDGVNR